MKNLLVGLLSMRKRDVIKHGTNKKQSSRSSCGTRFPVFCSESKQQHSFVPVSSTSLADKRRKTHRFSNRSAQKNFDIDETRQPKMATHTQDKPTKLAEDDTGSFENQNPSLQWTEHDSQGDESVSSAMQDYSEAKADHTSEDILVEFHRLQENGRVIYKEDRYEEALEVWRQAIEVVAVAAARDLQSPFPPILEQQKIRANMVACLLRMDQADEAVEEARKCIDMDDSWIKGHVRLAEALRQKGDFQQALNAIDIAILKDPDNGLTKKLAAEFLQDYEKALLSGKTASKSHHYPTEVDETHHPEAACTPATQTERFVSIFIADLWLIVSSIVWLIWRVFMCTFLLIAMIFSVSITSNQVFNWAWRRLKRERFVQWPLALDTIHQLWIRAGKKVAVVLVVWLVVTQVKKLYANPCAMETDDPYQMLQMHRMATKSEIVKAYRQLSVVCHPDKMIRSGVPPDVANERFAKINQAKEILTDPIKRPIYDNCGNIGLEMMQKMRVGTTDSPPLNDPAQFVCMVVEVLDEVETKCGKEAVRLILEQGKQPNEACQIVYMRRNQPEWGF